MKAFNKKAAQQKLNLKQNRNTYIKRLSISLSCMFLILAIMLFAFAKFESSSPEYTLINGRVDSSSGDVNVVSYVYDGTTNSIPPNRNDGYILTDLTCTGATGEWDDVNWKLTVSELSNKVKCTLTFDDQSNYQIIEYNANGGIVSQPYIKGTVGQQIGNLETPTREGYTFNGWYKEASLTTQVQSTTVIDSSLTTLYAKYTSNTASVTPTTAGAYFDAGTKNMTRSGYAYSSRPTFSSNVTVLWDNIDPTVSQASTTVTLSQSMQNFDLLEFRWYFSTSESSTILRYTYALVSDFSNNAYNDTPGGRITIGYINSTYRFARWFKYSSNTSVGISSCWKTKSTEAPVTSNTNMILDRISGIKYS